MFSNKAKFFAFYEVILNLSITLKSSRNSLNFVNAKRSLILELMHETMMTIQCCFDESK